jgi:hypothetical protein
MIDNNDNLKELDWSNVGWRLKLHLAVRILWMAFMLFGLSGVAFGELTSRPMMVTFAMVAIIAGASVWVVNTIINEGVAAYSIFSTLWMKKRDQQ